MPLPTLYHKQDAVPQPQHQDHEPHPQLQQEEQEELQHQPDNRANYFCPLCGKEFHGVRQRRNLKRHMMIHWGDKPFQCPFCIHRTNQKSNLKTHMLKAHRAQLELEGNTNEDA
ncbi:hypothetical protein Pmani_018740 [Petrolisthes manimaculis]|uniref:Protein hunchback n=1 Tax=Petrolisthes manimaculis TaxID=1843537 RepID=A0AAE1PLV0_9EUCA|nr:hypothetical protein Pmani_018740 [Petrolisthes manimaculis]